MDKETAIQKTAEHVKQILDGEASGHDWWHIYRVWKIAEHIGKQEKADLFVIQLTALLHDLDDSKITGNYCSEKKNAKTWMQQLELDAPTIQKVIHTIQNMSFNDNIDGKKTLTKEGQIVQDADRLDGIGAIGIARCFAYGGKKGRTIHNPEAKHDKNLTAEKYTRANGTSINHFYEKLLKLKESMNTQTAKKMAEHRHKFMEQYLEEFYSEWEGKK